MAESDAKLAEKINQIKTEIAEKLDKILKVLEKEDFKKKYMGGSTEGLQYETHYAQYENLTKEFSEFDERPDSPDSPKKNEMDVALFNRSRVEDKIVSLKNQAALYAAKWTTLTANLENKLNILGFQKKAADATIAKQRAEISKLTEELTRARNLKLELEKKNEIFQKRRMELLLDQVENPEAIIERDWHILQLEEAQAKMASEVGEKMNQALKGMETLSVKFEEEFGELVSRISEIKNELKDVMKWITDNRIKHNQHKREIARLVEELKEEKDEMEVLQKSGEDEMTRLNQSVERGEEMIGELEKMITEKDEQMTELETKMSEKESTISTLSETLQSIITTATTKMSMASS